MKTLITAQLIRSRIFATVAGLLFFTCTHAQNYGWVKHYESPGQEEGRLITTAPSGANYSVLFYNGTTTVGSQTFTAPQGGALLVRHNAAGTLTWAREYNDLVVLAMKATNDHVYLAGRYSQSGASIASHSLAPPDGWHDGFIVRLTDLGVVDLVINITGTGDDQILDLDVDAAGKMYVTGHSSDSAMYGGSAVVASGMPMFLAAFNGDGTLSWARKSSSGRGLKVTTDKGSSRIYVTASAASEQTVSFSHSAHTFTIPNNEYGSYFLASYDPSGALLKTVIVTNSFRRTANTMDATETNEFYLVLDEMYSSPSIRKYDNELNLKWQTDGPKSSVVSSFATDMGGNGFLTGMAYGEFTINGTHFGQDMPMYSTFIVKYSASGQILWVTGIEAIGPEVEDNGAIIRGIDTDDLNDVYITGRIRGPVSFMGHGTYTSTTGTDDFFVARLSGHSDYESVNEHALNTLQLYPTVNDGQFTIVPDKYAAGTLIIRDVAGRTMFSSRIGSGASQNNVSAALADGLYLVSFLHDDSRLEHSRIIVDRSR